MLPELVEQICDKWNIPSKIESYCAKDCDVEPYARKFECPECTDFILGERKIYPYLNLSNNINRMILDWLKGYYVTFYKLSKSWKVFLFMDLKDKPLYEVEGRTLLEALLKLVLEIGPTIISKEQILSLFDI